MPNDELVPTRRSTSPLDDCVRRSVEGRLLGLGNGGVVVSSSSDSNVDLPSLRPAHLGNTVPLVSATSICMHGDNSGVLELDEKCGQLAILNASGVNVSHIKYSIL